MTFGIIAGLAGYLAFGGLLAWVLHGSVDLKMPVWLQIPVIVLLWPLAIFILFYAFMSWISGGGH